MFSSTVAFGDKDTEIFLFLFLFFKVFTSQAHYRQPWLLGEGGSVFSTDELPGRLLNPKGQP